MLNRRTLFAATTAVAAIAAPTVAIAAVAHPGHDWFVSEARELIILTDRVNREKNDDLAEYWSARLDAFIKKAEDLPPTPENAAIKALAIAVLHHDEPDEWTMDMAADSRLAGQMVQCLTGRSA